MNIVAEFLLIVLPVVIGFGALVSALVATEKELAEANSRWCSWADYRKLEAERDALQKSLAVEKEVSEQLAHDAMELRKALDREVAEKLAMREALLDAEALMDDAPYDTPACDIVMLERFNGVLDKIKTALTMPSRAEKLAEWPRELEVEIRKEHYGGEKSCAICAIIDREPKDETSGNR